MFLPVRLSILLITLIFLFNSCNKTSTLTVTVNQQSSAQTPIVSSQAVVLVVNTSNSNDFKVGSTSSGGVCVINDVHAGNYQVSSEVWDASQGKGLYDTAYVQLKAGKSAQVNLLLK